MASIERIQKYLKATSQIEFETDEKTVDAVIRNFTVIGEAAARVPLSVRNLSPHIPWVQMVGMRNFLVHEYFGISMSVVWNTATKDLPPLLPQFIQLLSQDGVDVTPKKATRRRRHDSSQKRARKRK